MNKRMRKKHHVGEFALRYFILRFAHAGEDWRGGDAFHKLLSALHDAELSVSTAPGDLEQISLIVIRGRRKKVYSATEEDRAKVEKILKAFPDYISSYEIGPLSR